MPQWLIDLLVSAGLIKPEATEDEMKTAVQALLTKKTETEPKPSTETAPEVAAAQQAVETAQEAATTAQTATTVAEKKADEEEKKAANERKARIGDQLDFAVNTGRILEADRAAWNDRLKANFDVGIKELGERKAALNTRSLVGGLGARKHETSASSDKITAINEAVQKEARESGLDLATNDGHRKAFAAVKRKHPALFA